MLCTISVEQLLRPTVEKPLFRPLTRFLSSLRLRASRRSVRRVLTRSSELPTGPATWTIFRAEPPTCAQPSGTRPAPPPESPVFAASSGRVFSHPSTPPKLPGTVRLSRTASSGENPRPTLRIRFSKNIPASSPPSVPLPRSAQKAPGRSLTPFQNDPEALSQRRSYRRNSTAKGRVSVGSGGQAPSSSTRLPGGQERPYRPQSPRRSPSRRRAQLR